MTEPSLIKQHLERLGRAHTHRMEALQARIVRLETEYDALLVRNEGAFYTERMGAALLQFRNALVGMHTELALQDPSWVARDRHLAVVKSL